MYLTIALLLGLEADAVGAGYAAKLTPVGGVQLAVVSSELDDVELSPFAVVLWRT
jgi:hypothetical protein